MAPAFVQVLFGFATLLFASSAVSAESHTITFDNQCGHGTPTLVLNGKVVSTGQPFTNDAPISGIAYLQTGNCLLNGEDCTLMEMTLGNPTCAGCGSSADISLIAPHVYNVETSFSYYNGCDGQGALCDSPDCKTAFFQPNDNQVQVQCQADNVNLLITFCGDATKSGSPAAPAAPVPVKSSSMAAASTHESSSSAQPTPSAVQNVAPKPPAGATPAVPSPAASKTSSSAAAVSSSPAVNRPSCRNKRRDASPELLPKTEQESRALYNLHLRRQLAYRRSGAYGRATL